MSVLLPPAAGGAGSGEVASDSLSTGSDVTGGGVGGAGTVGVTGEVDDSDTDTVDAGAAGAPGKITPSPTAVDTELVVGLLRLSVELSAILTILSELITIYPTKYF